MSREQQGVPVPSAGQPGLARVGKYLMLELLGEGAFGKVRLAVDESSGKQYAMKIMAKSHIKANELTLQVRREIAVMKAMRHPNIVNLHEVLTSTKNLYMVMDLVTGGELFDAVAEQGRLSEATTRLYFQQLVDGIHYCHTRHVYHRDLKPENLLLSGDKQTLKITDFGLSSIKAQNAPSELLHTIMGSPHYIAPEIITSASEGYEGSKVDVWAAGIILFGMLAGFLPFDEADTKALYRSIVHSPVHYPPHFSYDVIKLLRSMLQKDPVRRPTMEQVKSFAWFKVDYEPAIVPETNHSSHTGEKTRKSRSRTKRKHDQGRRQKEDKDRKSSNFSTSQRSGDRPRSTKSIENSFRYGRVASKLSSGLLSERSRENSVSSDHFPEKEQNASPVDVPSKQESLSLQPSHDITSERVIEKQPVSLHDDEPTTATDEFRVRFSVRTESQSCVSTKETLSFSLEQPSFRKNVSDTNPLMTLRSSQSSADNGPCSWFSTAATSANQKDDVSPKAERSLFSQVGCGRKEDSRETEPEQSDMREPLDEDDTQSSGGTLIQDPPSELISPLSPAESNFSPLPSETVSAFRKGGKHASLGIIGNDITPTESKMSEFISPVSLQSQSSFSSPQASEEKMAGRHDYRALLPNLFQSTKSFVPPTVTKLSFSLKNTTQSNTEADQAFADFESDEKAVVPASDLALEESMLQPATEKEEDKAIFKPMKSSFAALIRQESEVRPSMAPSVYCPEVDYDSENGPYWAVDSVEVFADIEGEDSDAPEIGRTTPSQKLMKILRETRTPFTEKAGPSENLEAFSPATSGPIFAPLDDKLALKLSPSAEEVEPAPRAIRNLHVVDTA